MIRVNTPKVESVEIGNSINDVLLTKLYLGSANDRVIICAKGAVNDKYENLAGAVNIADLRKALDILEGKND